MVRAQLAQQMKDVEARLVGLRDLRTGKAAPNDSIKQIVYARSYRLAPEGGVGGAAGRGGNAATFVRFQVFNTKLPTMEELLQRQKA
jgi:hypothetical protein